MNPREYLPPETEKQYRELSRRQVRKKAVPALVWILLDLVCWILYVVLSGKSLTHPSAIFFTILLVLPFYPFRIHLLLWQETFYGTIADLRYERMMVTDWTSKTNRRFKDAFVLYIRTDEGITEKQCFIHNDDIKKCAYYKKDDRVLKLKGVKFPVKVMPPELLKENIFYQPENPESKREISNTPHASQGEKSPAVSEIFCPVCGTLTSPEYEKCTWCRTDLIKR